MRLIRMQNPIGNWKRLLHAACGMWRYMWHDRHVARSFMCVLKYPFLFVLCVISLRRTFCLFIWLFCSGAPPRAHLKWSHYSNSPLTGSCPHKLVIIQTTSYVFMCGHVCVRVFLSEFLICFQASCCLSC